MLSFAPYLEEILPDTGATVKFTPFTLLPLVVDFMFVDFFVVLLF